MKAKIILLTGIISLLACGNAYSQNWNKISKEIKRKQLLVAPEKKFINEYYKLRKKSGYLNRFSSITKSDTIFIIDYYSEISHSILKTAAWNKSDTAVCRSSNGGRRYENTYNDKYYLPFAKYEMELLSAWENIDNARAEGNSKIELHRILTECFTRIIFNEKGYIIECIYFKDFDHYEY